MKNWLRDIASIRALEQDWDSNGSAPIPVALCDSVVDVVEQLIKRGNQPPDRICASPTPGIIIEWQSTDDHMEIEMDVPYFAEWMLVRRGKSYFWTEAFGPTPAREES